MGMPHHADCLDDSGKSGQPLIETREGGVYCVLMNFSDEEVMSPLGAVRRVRRT